MYGLGVSVDSGTVSASAHLEFSLSCWKAADVRLQKHTAVFTSLRSLCGEESLARLLVKPRSYRHRFAPVLITPPRRRTERRTETFLTAPPLRCGCTPRCTLKRIAVCFTQQRRGREGNGMTATAV